MMGRGRALRGSPVVRRRALYDHIVRENIESSLARSGVLTPVATVPQEVGRDCDALTITRAAS
jgi:hypothetical protein